MGWYAYNRLSHVSLPRAGSNPFGFLRCGTHACMYLASAFLTSATFYRYCVSDPRADQQKHAKNIKRWGCITAVLLISNASAETIRGSNAGREQASCHFISDGRHSDRTNRRRAGRQKKTPDTPGPRDRNYGAPSLTIHFTQTKSRFHFRFVIKNTCHAVPCKCTTTPTSTQPTSVIERRQAGDLPLHPAARSAQKDSEARTCCPLLPPLPLPLPFPLRPFLLRCVRLPRKKNTKNIRYLLLFGTTSDTQAFAFKAKQHPPPQGDDQITP